METLQFAEEDHVLKSTRMEVFSQVLFPTVKLNICS